MGCACPRLTLNLIKATIGLVCWPVHPGLPFQYRSMYEIAQVCRAMRVAENNVDWMVQV